MGKKGALLFLLLLILIASSDQILEQADSSVIGDKRTFQHIVLVTFDGARKHWIDVLMENGTLPTLAVLKNQGGETTLRITDHDPSTDPGMACIESGYGPDITGIDMNYFASRIKPSIPEGLTTTERIKSVYGDSWKTALILPWTQGPVNVTNTMDSTFWNQRDETDYWFSSENITWSENDLEVLKNSLSFTSALLRANYTAHKVAEFIHTYSSSNFYVRTHFVEPDHAGHQYGESLGNSISPKYKQGLIECDAALRIIVEALKDTGIYNETVILVSTDHGFKGVGHGPPPYPFGDHDITETWLISSDPEVTNELGWGLQNDISPTCLGLAGIDQSAFKPYYDSTSKALPIWEATLSNREMTPPSISEVSYPGIIRGGEAFNVTARIEDESGIRAAQIRYIYGTIWRTRRLEEESGNLYRASLGPFIEGTEVRWYLLAVDNSTSLNMVYYPEDKTPLTFTVSPGITVDNNPPSITDINYSEEVVSGEAFIVSTKVQDESGVSSVKICYSYDSEWECEELNDKGDGVYEGSIGPFDAGAEVRWYLKATDASINQNTAFHPPDKQPLVFKVEAAEEIPIELLAVGGALAIVVVAIMIYRFKGR